MTVSWTCPVCHAQNSQTPPTATMPCRVCSYIVSWDGANLAEPHANVARKLYLGDSIDPEDLRAAFQKIR